MAAQNIYNTQKQFNDKYELGTEIGQGGFGKVYEITCKSNSKKFAAKFQCSDDIEIHTENLEEMVLHQQLTDMKIAGIAVCKEAYQWKDNQLNYYSVLIMDKYVCSLEEKINETIDKGQKFDENDIDKLINQILLAYYEFYVRFDEKIVHRDIKSKNILLDANLKPHITDFGCSRQKSSSIKATVTGTIPYMSPKLFQDYRQCKSQSDHDMMKSDIFSLGVLFLQIIKQYKEKDLTRLQLNNNEKNVENEVQNIKEQKYKDLLKNMLNYDEIVRFNLQECAELLKLQNPQNNVFTKFKNTQQQYIDTFFTTNIGEVELNNLTEKLRQEAIKKLDAFDNYVLVFSTSEYLQNSLKINLSEYYETNLKSSQFQFHEIKFDQFKMPFTVIHTSNLQQQELRRQFTKIQSTISQKSKNWNIQSIFIIDKLSLFDSKMYLDLLCSIKESDLVAKNKGKLRRGNLNEFVQLILIQDEQQLDQNQENSAMYSVIKLNVEYLILNNSSYDIKQFEQTLLDLEIKNGHILLLGNSGVGKSELINSLKAFPKTITGNKQNSQTQKPKIHQIQFQTPQDRKLRLHIIDTVGFYSTNQQQSDDQTHANLAVYLIKQGYNIISIIYVDMCSITRFHFPKIIGSLMYHYGKLKQEEPQQLTQSNQEEYQKMLEIISSDYSFVILTGAGQYFPQFLLSKTQEIQAFGYKCVLWESLQLLNGSSHNIELQKQQFIANLSTTNQLNFAISNVTVKKYTQIRNSFNAFSLKNKNIDRYYFFKSEGDLNDVLAKCNSDEQKFPIEIPREAYKKIVFEQNQLKKIQNVRCRVLSTAQYQNFNNAIDKLFEYGIDIQVICYLNYLSKYRSIQNRQKRIQFSVVSALAIEIDKIEKVHLILQDNTKSEKERLLQYSILDNLLSTKYNISEAINQKLFTWHNWWELAGKIFKECRAKLILFPYIPIEACISLYDILKFIRSTLEKEAKLYLLNEADYGELMRRIGKFLDLLNSDNLDEIFNQFEIKIDVQQDLYKINKIQKIIEKFILKFLEEKRPLIESIVDDGQQNQDSIEIMQCIREQINILSISLENADKKFINVMIEMDEMKLNL